MRKTIIIIIIVIIASACSHLRHVQVVERVSSDTLYLNHIQYDSIYVDNWHSIEYHPFLNPQLSPLTSQPSPLTSQLSPLNSQLSTLNRIDTVFITEKSVEYKYRMLRDTVRVVQIDTIPVIREVEVVKTERYVPGVYKWSLGICIALICVIFIICALCALKKTFYK